MMVRKDAFRVPFSLFFFFFFHLCIFPFYTRHSRLLTSSPPQTGLPPFYDENVNTMYQRILRDPLVFPPDMSYEAKSVMTGLLQRDPSRRLGHHGGEEIKRHPFFARHVDWNRYANTFTCAVLF